jgi:potassium channel subfamily K, other eukaryote
MNDPGLDQPIDQAESQVHDTVGKPDNGDEQQKFDEEEEEMNYMMPARWWYASTAIPLLAGTFGPMASAFSICALVENWRVEIPPGGTEGHGINIKDPNWYVCS